MQKDRIYRDRANSAGDGRASTGFKLRRFLTAMGVLEALMWCAGAAVLLAFWLWARPSDIPPFGSASFERGRAAVRVAGTTPNERPDPKHLEEWQEGSRAATTTALQDREPDPISTGSSSTVARSIDSPSTDTVLPQAGEGGADGRAEIAAVNKLSPQDGAGNTGPLGTQTPVSEVSLIAGGEPIEEAAIESATLLQALIALPSQPPLLALFGVPSWEKVDGWPEELVLQNVSDPVPAEADPDVMTETESPKGTVPEVEIAIANDTRLSSPEASGPHLQNTEQHAGIAISSTSVDRDFLIRRGEELLARGDLAGARLVFGRAAGDGDPRGAIGMARSFDPETLLKVRVLGIRPDPDQAAQWYARSKVLQAVASVR